MQNAQKPNHRNQTHTQKIEDSLSHAGNFVFASSSISTEQQTHELERIITGLIDILDRENDLIIEKPLVNIAALKELGRGKQKLFDEYHALSASFASLKNFAGSLSGQVKSKMKNLFANYEKSAQINQKRLTVALEASSVILRAVASAQENQAKAVSYNEFGVLKKQDDALPLGIQQEF